MGLVFLPYRCVDCDLRLFQFRSDRAARSWRLVRWLGRHTLVILGFGAFLAAGDMAMVAYLPKVGMSGLIAISGPLAVAFDVAVFLFCKALRRKRQAQQSGGGLS